MTSERHVFVLQVFPDEGEPDIVVFDALPKLHQHVVDMVIKNIDKYDERFALPLRQYGENKMYNHFIKLWHHARMHNEANTGFYACWEEEPQVVL